MQQSNKRKKLTSTENSLTESTTENHDSKELIGQLKDRTNIPKINEVRKSTILFFVKKYFYKNVDDYKIQPKTDDLVHVTEAPHVKTLDDLTDEENSELLDHSDNESVRDANNNEREATIAEEHIQLMEEQKNDAISSGYLLPTTDFSQLQYEDPMVVKLKKTDVSNFG